MEDNMATLSSLLISRDREIAKVPPWSRVVRGTLVRYHLTCGKRSCRCHRAKRYRHGPYWYLAVSTQGKKRMALIPSKQVPQIKKGISAYAQLWKRLCRISEINVALLKGGLQGKQ